MGFKITNASNDRKVLWIYGEIGSDVTADEVRIGLSQVPDKQDIDVRVHSDGGDFHEGIAMHSLITRRKGAAFGIVDGMAASAATFPLMACRHVEMARGSWMVIHEASGELRGGASAEEFRMAAQHLDETNKQIRAIYAQRWKGAAKELSEALATDTWLTAEEAVKRGLADSISDAMAIAAKIDPAKFGYRNTPEILIGNAVGQPLVFAMLEERKQIIDNLFPTQEAV